ncbi:glycosyltransferase [uncultured Acetobacteroides sp.]|uniref:glycosyltransferase n=1 Tax=uncultured Acetobacteroides sp. TaxID=1760811 RepID=UPI0029F5B9C3|nr:glycosyltransferase [uncultured Acetobacteroides sp.]
MKILYISNNYLNGNSGGNYATRAFVNAFAEIADEILLLYPDKGQDIKKYVNNKIKYKGVSNNKNNIEKLFDIYIGKINRYTNVVITEIKKFDPDIVVFDGSRNSAGLIKKINKKIITIHHNYEIEYYKDTPPSILWRIPFMYYIKKAEKNAVQLSDVNLTLTNQDIKLLKMHYDHNNTVKFKKVGCFECEKKNIVPNFLEKEQDNNSLVFAITGSLCDIQTVNPIIQFIYNYYPIILKKHPNSKLIISGKNPSNKIIKSCSKFPDSIILIPNPDNMQEVIHQADIYICPINLGGGLKLRIMDGLKAGLPVLSHVVSSRGYDDFQNVGYLFVYENKKTFTEMLEQLLLEREKGKLDKMKIKNHYSTLFSFESGVKRLRHILSNDL